MRKWLCFIAVSVFVLALYGCSNPEQVEVTDKWYCTVTCAEESTDDSYVITYSEEKIISNTGVITFENRNDFPIFVHLISNGKEEFNCEIEAGGTAGYLQADTEATYTVGIHADVDEGTEIKLMVYDGGNSGRD